MYIYFHPFLRLICNSSSPKLSQKLSRCTEVEAAVTHFWTLETWTETMCSSALSFEGYGLCQETVFVPLEVLPLYTRLTKYPLKNKDVTLSLRSVDKNLLCVNTKAFLIAYPSCCSASSSTWSRGLGTSGWLRSRSSRRRWAAPNQSPKSEQEISVKNDSFGY